MLGAKDTVEIRKIIPSNKNSLKTFGFLFYLSIFANYK